MFINEIYFYKTNLIFKNNFKIKNYRIVLGLISSFDIALRKYSIQICIIKNISFN